MPRGSFLSEPEKAVIRQLHTLGLSIRNIAERVNRSKTVVHNYLTKMETYGQRVKNKGNTKVTDRQKRQIVHLASAGNTSARQIIETLQLPVKRRAVCKILEATGHFKYTKNSVNRS